VCGCRRALADSSLKTTPKGKGERFTALITFVIKECFFFSMFGEKVLLSRQNLNSKK